MVSPIVAVSLHEAIGDQLTSALVDTGMMREREARGSTELPLFLKTNRHIKILDFWDFFRWVVPEAFKKKIYSTYLQSNSKL